MKNFATPDPLRCSPAAPDDNSVNICPSQIYTSSQSTALTLLIAPKRTIWDAHAIGVRDDILDVNTLIFVDQAAVRVGLLVNAVLERLHRYSKTCQTLTGLQRCSSTEPCRDTMESARTHFMQFLSCLSCL